MTNHILGIFQDELQMMRSKEEESELGGGEGSPGRKSPNGETIQFGINVSSGWRVCWRFCAKIHQHVFEMGNVVDCVPQLLVTLRWAVDSISSWAGQLVFHLFLTETLLSEYLALILHLRGQSCDWVNVTSLSDPLTDLSSAAHWRLSVWECAVCLWRLSSPFSWNSIHTGPFRVISAVFPLPPIRSSRHCGTAWKSLKEKSKSSRSASMRKQRTQLSSKMN